MARGLLMKSRNHSSILDSAAWALAVAIGLLAPVAALAAADNVSFSLGA